MKKVFAKKALLASGWVDDVRLEVVDGQITAVTSAATADADDMSVGFVIPGLCNAHSHAFQRALAGHTEQRSPAGRDNFWTWRERMYDLAGRVDAEILSAIARQAYIAKCWPVVTHQLPSFTICIMTRRTPLALIRCSRRFPQQRLQLVFV